MSNTSYETKRVDDFPRSANIEIAKKNYSNYTKQNLSGFLVVTIFKISFFNWTTNFQQKTFSFFKDVAMCRIQTILTIPSSVFPKAKNEIRTGLFCCLRLYISYQLYDAYLVVFEFTPAKQKKRVFLP